MEPKSIPAGSGLRDETWVEYYTRCIAELQSDNPNADKAGAAAEIQRGARFLDEDQIRREQEYAADDYDYKSEFSQVVGRSF